MLSADPSLNAGLFQVSLTTTSLVRISGFYFDLGTFTSYDRYGVAISGNITQIRVDHNKFNRGKAQILIDGAVKGVLDQNCFYNSNISTSLLGGAAAAQGNQSWADPIVAGMDMGLNTLYVEDNTFTRDQTLACGSINLNCHIESGHGGRFVIRHNTFTGTWCYNECILAQGDCYADAAIMTHGNGNYYNGSTDLRGHPIVEVYNNTINMVRVTGYALTFRGGSVLAHNNAITVGMYPQYTYLSLIEEETWSSTVFSPLRTAWPAEDQIFNSFFWNNTVNGNPIELTTDSATFHVQDRDYFLHAPAATGGKETFTGRAGASNTAPTEGSPSTMQFSSSGANAYYPYTPFTYPHPLRAGDNILPGGITLGAGGAGSTLVLGGN